MSLGGFAISCCVVKSAASENAAKTIIGNDTFNGYAVLPRYVALLEQLNYWISSIFHMYNYRALLLYATVIGL